MTKPDWKNIDDYRLPKCTSLDRWAFEFLRRNDDFLTQFDAAKQENYVKPTDRPTAWNETPLGKILEKYGVYLPILPEWNESGIWDSPFIFNKHPISATRFEIKQAGGLFTDKAIGKEFFIHEATPANVALVFDLSQPINPQIERAKATIKSSQKCFNGTKREVGKSIVKLYPFYLRVLDAYKADVHSAKICEVLSNDYKSSDGGVSDDTLRNWKKEAERLRDGGYLEIVKNTKP